jgi:hypothetical protein
MIRKVFLVFLCGVLAGGLATVAQEGRTLTLSQMVFVDDVP